MHVGKILALVFVCVSVVVAEAGQNPQPISLPPALDGDFDFFGESVALDIEQPAGTRWLVVGAPGRDESAGTDSGAAYVYRSTGAGWTLNSTLLPTNLESGDQLGSVDIDGNTIALGAWTDDQGATIDSGAAYVYVRSGTTWAPQGGTILASDRQTGDRFGAVALSGNTLVVGARRADAGASVDAGKAYVFVRGGSCATTWCEQEILSPQAADHNSGDQFGSVAIDGDRIVVGAWKDDPAPGLENAGAAYVFRRQGTIWSQEGPKLTASDMRREDRFGDSVAISGDLVVVGACRAESMCPDVVEGMTTITPADCNRGAAYVFRRSGTNWVEEQKLFAELGPDPDTHSVGDMFGYSVDIQGSRIAVGAPHLDSPPDQRVGAVYTFFSNAGTGGNPGWVRSDRFTAPPSTMGSLFGNDVALAQFGSLQSLVVCGAPWEHHSNELFAGTVYSIADEGLFRTFCFGDGANQGTDPMCANECACSNESPLGHGRGCVNSSGFGARLSVAGSASISANDLRFSMEGGPTSAPGILASGLDQLPNQTMFCPAGSGVPSPVFDGLRCVGANLLRHGIRTMNAQGATQNPWQVNVPGVTTTPGMPVVSGSSRNFQVIYRDTTGPCGTGQNTTQGIGITFTP